MNENTQELFDNFTAVIRDLTEVAGHITQIEDDKANAASLKRHERMDGYIKKEQADILKLRGLEQHRIKLAKSLGWDSLTFRQILEKTEPDRQEVLKPLFEDLEQQLKRLRESRSAAEQIINVRIHELETAIARQQGGAYDNSGNVSPTASPRQKMRDVYG